MVFLLSHCGVTNTIYHASHFPGAFTPPFARSTGLEGRNALCLDLEEGSVPQPWFLAEIAGAVPKSEEPYFAVTQVPTSPGDDEFVGLFFERRCLTCTFFIASFPSKVYPLARDFRWVYLFNYFI